MKKGVFITGTDTGVGKTIVTGLLARYCNARGYSVITQKWVQTGTADDIRIHDSFFNDCREQSEMEPFRRDPGINGQQRRRCCYSFSFPASPHLAAALAKQKIRASKIKQDFCYLAQRYDWVIVEGTGGSLVPYDRHNFLIDIAKELELILIIVAANKLGVINHTLLTGEALKHRKMTIAGVIFNQLPTDKKLLKSEEIILKNNPKIIQELGAIPSLGILEASSDQKKLYRNFQRIGDTFFKKIV